MSGLVYATLPEEPSPPMSAAVAAELQPEDEIKSAETPPEEQPND